ncbi:Iron-sulfur clusters transporter atm1, mitochondrial [Nosema granulosis]|uniref:Iron-sulfur clusters transporter atm1, mitochondrial n=1 Tax=Nosema granulosis TaxID=83296 RepID=A0A9P6KYP4_9MICR|nr:Iron-sulfur clusters transporter atm1, mitochondrial [Nosema granulosis]
MKSQEKIRYFAVFIETMKYIAKNPLFKIAIIPIAVLNYLSASFAVYVLKMISAIEIWLIAEEKPYSAEYLFLRYMYTPLIHYTLLLALDLLVAFFIQNVIRLSFNKFTDEYLKVCYESYHRLGSGQIHSLIERRTEAIKSVLRLFLAKIFHNLIYTFVAYKTILREVDHQAFYAHIALFVIFLVSTHYILVVRNMYRLKYNLAYNKASNRTYGILVNYDVIKAYNNDALELKKLDKNLDEVETRSLIFEILGSFLTYVQKNAVVIPNGYIIYLALTGKYFHKLSDKNGFVLYNKLYCSIKNSIGFIREDVLSITQYLTDIGDSKVINALKDEDNSGSLIVQTFKNEIVLKNLTAYVEEQKIFTIDEVTIKKGEKVAIVGKNGTGKSTLLNIILRLRDYEGNAYIDSIEMREISKTHQRSMISYIPQNPSVFEGSVLDNLRYACPNTDEQKIMAICEEFRTHELFAGLKDGYQTEVGESGKYLSGGQKQKLSFMRAVLKDGDIFLFDEPTSNLDVQAEEEVLNHLFSKLQAKTALVILHNPIYLSKFDKILGIYNGEVKVYEKYSEFVKSEHLY